MARLEVLQRMPRGRRRGPALLFVHGAYAAAWCWAENFLPFLARAGYASYAVSLRGHGGSPGIDGCGQPGLDDYVNDVLAAVSRIGEPVVLAGHSMGGAVVQRCAGGRIVLGRALLASVPPLGLWECAIELGWRDPMLAAQLALVHSGHTAFINFASLRGALFAPQMPEARAAEYLMRMQPESPRALLDLTMLHLAPPLPTRGEPTLVLGGELDGLFPPSIIARTARSYRVEPVMVSGLSHLVMLDVRWRAAAEVLVEWLRELPSS